MIVPATGEVSGGAPTGSDVLIRVQPVLHWNPAAGVALRSAPKVMLATPLLGNANVAAAVVAPMQARHFIPVLNRDHSSV
jgi:hypothetical protein